MDRDSLVRDSIPLVRRLAASIATRLPAHVELADLTQAGFVGLLDAAHRFDRRKGARFSTYAERRIRGAIVDSLRELDWAPRSVRRKRREIDGALARLEARLGRKASESELARELRVSPEHLSAILERLRSAEAATDWSVGLDTLLPQLPDPNASSPHDLLERSELVRALARAIEKLPDRERLVVTLYYHEELQMKEIGEILGVNESRVSQIHSEAVRKLKRWLR